MLDFGDQTM